MKRIPQYVLLVLLVFLLFWRWQVSQTRFFDVDEFSYLHWTANLMKGNVPYKDFFMIFTPGFLWFFAPFLKIFWMSPTFFLAARVIAFFVFLGVLGSLGILFGKTRGWRWALLPVVILAFLPMPYDKFLEVRPDNLAMLLAMIAVLWQISGKGFWAGIFYALSLIVFIKTAPFVFVGFCFALLTKGDTRAFFVGFFLPFVLLFVWMLTIGDFSAVWYNVAVLPFETTKMGQLDAMEPNLFFFPNASFYGGWGLTPGLLTNHAFWIIGLLFGVYRFFTPFISGRRVAVEFLISGIFLLSVAGYILFFPLKHSQYLIPIAIFVSYYAADTLRIVFTRTPVLLLIFVPLFIVVNAQVNTPKLQWNNRLQLTQVAKLLELVPKDARVLDMEGRMVFWPDAYYICCVPFGSFRQFMSQKSPNLVTALEASNTKYIYQGDTNRLAQLSSFELKYIEEYYVRVPDWGDTLWVRASK